MTDKDHGPPEDNLVELDVPVASGQTPEEALAAAMETYEGDPEDVQQLEINCQMFGVKVRQEPDGSIIPLEDLGLMSASSETVELARGQSPAENPGILAKTRKLMSNMLPVNPTSKKGE